MFVLYIKPVGAWKRADMGEGIMLYDDVAALGSSSTGRGHLFFNVTALVKRLHRVWTPAVEAIIVKG